MKSAIVYLSILALVEKSAQPVCVLDIRQEVKHINGVSKFKIVTIDNNDSNEGGDDSYYFYNNNLCKVISKSYGETGQRIIEYYYKDQKLIFTFAKSLKYFPNTTKTECSTEVRNYYVNGTKCNSIHSDASSVCHFIETDSNDFDRSKYFLFFVKKNPKTFYSATHQF